MSKVRIICKYYQVRELNNDEVTDDLYDLRSWIKDISEKKYEERIKSINDVRGRIEDIRKMNSTNVFAFNFMRFDEISTSYIVKAVKEAEHIDLEPDEYIAKNTVCVYDANNGIIMIQSNRGGYSERTIQSYINAFIESEQKCALLPIIEKKDLFKTSSEYLKLDLRLANFSEIEATKGTNFEKILDCMNKYEGVNAHLEISLGNERNRKLNTGLVQELFMDLIRNRGCVNSAKVKLSDDNVSNVYDLFDNMCKDTIECEVDNYGGITFKNLSNKMKDKYMGENVSQRLSNALL